MNPRTLATIILTDRKTKTAVSKTVQIPYVTPGELSSAAQGVEASLITPDVQHATIETEKDANIRVAVRLHNEGEPPDAPVKVEYMEAGFDGITFATLADALASTSIPDAATVEADEAQARAWEQQVLYDQIREFEELTGTAADIRPPASVEEAE